MSSQDDAWLDWREQIEYRLRKLEVKASPRPSTLSRQQTKERARAITDTDKPTEKHFEFGRTLKIDVGPEWGKFKNYCLAHGKRYANFEAAFRNWLANSVNMNGGKR